MHPHFITIGGMSGTGKTTLARALSEMIADCVHIDSDHVRKELAGVSKTTRLTEEFYSAQKNQELTNDMARRVKEALAAGKSVIVSTAITSEIRRKAQEDLAQECGVPLTGIMLTVNDVQTLFDRVSARKDDASDANENIVKLQQKWADGTGSWSVIDATQPPEKVLSDALDIIKAKGKTATPKSTPVLK